jgi:uncharacterized membrane protein YcjF (UPF0283 family)
MLRRTIRALAASVATGVAVYVTVVRLGLPSIARSLSPEQVDWLRRAFATHPWLVMSSAMVMALALALPVLIAFRLAFGPMRGEWRRPLQ